MDRQDPRPKALDLAAFERLLVEALPRAYRAALGMTRDPVEAEDVVQDAAMQAFKGRHGFQPGTNFRAWFLKVLLNAFLMRCRKDRRHEAAIPLDDVPDAFLYSRLAEAGVPVDDISTAHAFFSGLHIEAISSAIDELPLQYRIVASLYFVEDLSYAEIAEILDCPIGTVRSRLHRARAALQRALWQTAVELGVVQPTENDSCR